MRMTCILLKIKMLILGRNFKAIWFHKHITHWRFYVLCILHNSLPTRDHSTHWYNNGVTECCLCNHLGESNENLFFECPYSKYCMEHIAMKSMLKTQGIKHTRDLVDLVNNIKWEGNQTIFLWANTSAWYYIGKRRRRECMDEVREMKSSYSKSLISL